MLIWIPALCAQSCTCCSCLCIGLLVCSDGVGRDCWIALNTVSWVPPALLRWSPPACPSTQPSGLSVRDGIRSQQVRSLSFVAAKAAPWQVAAWPVWQWLQHQFWRCRRRRWWWRSWHGDRRKAACIQSWLWCVWCRHSGMQTFSYSYYHTIVSYTLRFMISCISSFHFFYTGTFCRIWYLEEGCSPLWSLWAQSWHSRCPFWTESRRLKGYETIQRCSSWWCVLA